jgi:hypothetical protein
MKIILLIALSILSVMSANASLVGSLEGDKVHAYFDIRDYQQRNTVGVEFDLGNDSVNSKYTQTFFNINVEDYLEIFNTANSVTSESPELDYTAIGIVSQRIISFTSKSIDDGGDIAKKEVTTIRLHGDRADISIEAFRRKRSFFVLGKLKSVSVVTVNDIKIIRNGVSLYGDNRGWPLGKVITETALLKAASDTSTNGLEAACEVDCQ